MCLQGTYKGAPAEHYQWKEVAFGVLTMSTTDFYAAQSNGAAVPLGQNQKLTPFGGPQIGTATVDWAGLKPGTQPTVGTAASHLRF